MLDSKREVFAYRDFLLKSAFDPIELTQKEQHKELINLVSFARNNNRFYRKFFPDPSTLTNSSSLAEALVHLPIMNRDLVQQNFADLKIYLPGTDAKKYGISYTSGSTGQPLKVSKYVPRYERDYFAISLVEWEWFKRDLNKTFGFFRIGIEDQPNLVMGPPISYLGPSAPAFEYRADTRSLTDLANALVQKQPDYLFCNGITLRLLAKEFLKGNFPRVKIEQLLVVSDPVTDEFRELMFEAFSAKTIDRYSCEEFGLFGLQCPGANHLHIVAPDFILEVLDENNHPVEAGDYGRAVITGLANRAMPLVRYQLGDWIKTGKNCPAGITWPIVEQISGRIRDFVTWPDGTTTIATFVMSPIVYLSDLYDYSCILFDDAIFFAAGVDQALSASTIATIESELVRIFGPGKEIIIWQTQKLPLIRMHKRPEFFKLAGTFARDFDPVSYFEQVFKG